MQSDRVFHLLKCYRDKQEIQLDPLTAKMAPHNPEVDPTKDPVFIDFQTLVGILRKDLEARQIRQDIELTRLKRKQLQERLKAQENDPTVSKYRVLYEEYLLNLLNYKQDADPDVDLAEVYPNISED